jgi:formylglycine-generating enzyme required for sulfatase activity
MNSTFPIRRHGQHRTSQHRACFTRAGSLVLLSLSLTLLLSCGGEVKKVKVQVPDLPKEPGKSVAIDLPGLPRRAKKLELVLVPGLGGSVMPFFMGKYEVTQGQYAAVMDKNPSDFKNGRDYPVEMVSWDDAKEFCRRLTAGLPDKFKGQFAFRLPTDAEWSVAVGLAEERGSSPMEKFSNMINLSGKIRGLFGKIGDVYPWGTQWEPPSGVGNYADETAEKRWKRRSKNYGDWETIAGYDDGYAYTAPVGSFMPNQYGLYDLGGNVWEWCEDWYTADQKCRVLRGASWEDGESSNLLLSAYRWRDIPVCRCDHYGFRCVLGVVFGIGVRT